MELRLGIGVVTYNRRDILSATLDRVVRHTRHRPNCVVVADDGSTDGTQEMLRARGVAMVGGRNRGVAWNKNRALFVLSELWRCDVVILLEDDTYPVRDHWEEEWMVAGQRWGHANLFVETMRLGLRSGAGTVDDPMRGTQVSGQCGVFSRDALRFGGYFSSRFQGYGHEHVEFSRRLVRLGYGGADQIIDGQVQTVFWMLRGALRAADATSTFDAASEARNREIARTLMGEEGFRAPWSNDAEMRLFRDEMHRFRERCGDAMPGAARIWAQGTGNAEPAEGADRLTPARCALEDGDAEQAANLCLALLAEQPDDAATAHLLGLALLARGETARALGCLRKAVAVRPDWPAALHDCAMVMIDLDLASEALVYLARGLELEPSDPGLLHQRGRALARLHPSDLADAAPDPLATPKGSADYLDPAWYLANNLDVASASLDPTEHFIAFGAQERRNPNAWFHGDWYLRCNADVRTTGVNPLDHYMLYGEAELRNPHPRFDAAWYAGQHPEAGDRPLLYHLRVGQALGWPTERPVSVAAYLPSKLPPFVAPDGLAADIVIPVYRGLDQTRRCLLSVLRDANWLPGRIIVVDDHSTDRELTGWLQTLAADGTIELIRNPRNLGFAASVNLGIAAAGRRDVVLLNSDTEVADGWLGRLAAQAYSQERIASASPLSNNATICGYPGNNAAPMPFGLGVTAVDAACRMTNAGRQIEVPTTVGFCMYLRRDALDDVGLFDSETFGLGYGEENDFCMRARARGWLHVLACDVFVYHEGAASFGNSRLARVERAQELLAARHPTYAALVALHVEANETGPVRFAITAALFRGTGLPTILMVSHDLGGGVAEHVASLIGRLAGQANVLQLGPTETGVRLSVPALSEHPPLELPPVAVDTLAEILAGFAVSRVHVHHLARMEMDIRALVGRLGVAFDVTMHDYFALCPQINLLPMPEGVHCGEPGPAVCNDCIAHRPSYGARDILSWRLQHGWLFQDADRVICPSEDTCARLAQAGLAGRAIVRPHAPVEEDIWRVAAPAPVGARGGRLRVAVLGTLASHKGAHVVAEVLAAMDRSSVELRLLGATETDFPTEALGLLDQTGPYAAADLPGMIAEFSPHVAWFPATWPETYSYTLSAALAAGVAIVAPRIGAFPERLRGRPLTWLVEPGASAEEWLRCFETARAALRAAGGVPQTGLRATAADFYERDYLAPMKVQGERAAPQTRSPAVISGGGRTRVVIVPERLDNGAFSPCAYIRLLQPFDHLRDSEGLDIVLADHESACRQSGDIFATQRQAVPTTAAADALATHARAIGAKLIYDLDDDLLHVPREHADANALRPGVRAVRRMLRHADQVWISTPALGEEIAAGDGRVRIVPNALDERLWRGGPMRPGRLGPVRILYMGTATHDADLALIEPALERLARDFSGLVEIGIVGVTRRLRTEPWLRPQLPSAHAGSSYPGFVDWITRQQPWDIGLAPLENTRFNRGKSPIKVLDYAALQMAVLASDVPVYRGLLADGCCGRLVGNSTQAWYGAMSHLVRDNAARGRLARGAHDLYLAQGTLASQADIRRAALRDLLG